ncbi:nucleotidyl transferase AbiEii/AbiGii toxin family protein [Chitinophaga oryziterrae]|uniref:Nucleotidyl transferase AbiEii/AbiGii toxin family protein n=1 Tax=Chitinophaga oryziterrae TaxID=1031224 RepID=A0A6N8J407_9BACT|nr:nucleotidyl transferase AbiEii/AbiGii toxin family protein [Chitinophaga oryziterrae]MVT39431.1 nucleotidyl transferase AbiEii/AbiGii toxin family protein [Chitinophaga oryziterrae]
MIGWLQLTPEQRRIAINQAAIQSGITAKAIEKDWWVTLVLKALFELPISSHFVFKGGTCLSKGFKLIQRFSEDIDISLDPQALDQEYTVQPSKTFVKRLKKLGCRFTTNEIQPALRQQLASYGVGADLVTITAKPIPEKMPDTDPQTLFVKYQSLYLANPYLADEVKVEFSIRSLHEPTEPVVISSLLWEHFSNNAYQETPFTITAAHPLKTLMEKIFLLHEKFIALGDNPEQTDPALAERQSRHLGDIISLSRQGYGEQLLQNPTLYQQIVEHRRHWISYRGLEYDTLYPASVSFLPPPSLLERYRSDYTVMRTEMIYGESLDFDEILEEIAELNKRIAQMALQAPAKQLPADN